MGKIFLVGFGPGAAPQMTERARQAIDEAETVIGYSTYIQIVADQLKGKEVIKKGMTEELDRCVLAYEKALAGGKVALISSGDIGVYGMAGPMYEYLFEQGWQPGQGVEVEVVTGVTALCAAASLVGAPLTHDFCSISLSDLLTPWAVIAGRLEAAARADFVVALYNPKSGRRRGQIIEAARILLKYRSPQTPVAVVKSAYRPKERIVCSTLVELAEQEIGMLTTVLIGNSSSFIQQGLLVTPRGYANKYSAPGQLKAGEEAGKSLSLGLKSWPERLKKKLDQGQSPLQIAQGERLPLGEILFALEPAQSVPDPLAALQSALSQGGRLICMGRLKTSIPLAAQELAPQNPFCAIQIGSGHISLNTAQLAMAYQLGERLYWLDPQGEVLLAIAPGRAG